MTPDGLTLTVGRCVCAIHCVNRCDECAASKKRGPWCRCICHQAEYERMRAAKPASGLRCAKCLRPIAGTSEDPKVIECDNDTTSIWCRRCDDQHRIQSNGELSPPRRIPLANTK